MRIVAIDYLPNEMDVLRARTKTTGIYETRFQMGQLSIQYVGSCPLARVIALSHGICQPLTVVVVCLMLVVSEVRGRSGFTVSRM